MSKRSASTKAGKNRPSKPINAESTSSEMNEKPVAKKANQRPSVAALQKLLAWPKQPPDPKLLLVSSLRVPAGELIGLTLSFQVSEGLEADRAHRAGLISVYWLDRQNRPTRERPSRYMWSDKFGYYKYVNLSEGNEFREVLRVPDNCSMMRIETRFHQDRGLQLLDMQFGVVGI